MSNMGMPILSTAQLSHGIVEMHGQHLIQATGGSQPLNRGLGPGSGGHVVTRRHRMTGIEADTDPLRDPHVLANPPQMTEVVPKIGPTSHGVF